MTTIPQLPNATTVGLSDLLPISQNGVLFAATVGQVTSGLQQNIVVPTGDLLGRASAGAGAPEPLGLGIGVALNGTNLTANGLDHGAFPDQVSLSATDELIINASGQPSRVPASAIMGLFTAGAGIELDSAGTISVIPSAVAGPAGPVGGIGPTGPAGPAGAIGPAGAGLLPPGAANAASMIGEADSIAIWQNGANAWITYKQLIAGQTIDQLPSAGPAGDTDLLLVAQGGNALTSQSFAAIWSYILGKLPTVMNPVVELTTNTVLDSTTHNQRLLVASEALTLSANFVNMGSGFFCRLINLSSGAIIMGTGITAGSGATILPPGGVATFEGITYSGGSLVWWDGAVSMAPILTVAPIDGQVASVGFNVSGSVFNDSPVALDYSTDGVTWYPAPNLAINLHDYSFAMPGLAAGTYRLSVRDHADPTVIGVSADFAVGVASVSIGVVPNTATAGSAFNVSGAVFPSGRAVSVGLSASATAAPSAYNVAAVSGSNWTASVTPSGAGTAYLWVQQTADPSAQSVSSAISVTGSASVSYTVNQPSSLSYSVGSGSIALNGGVSPPQAIGTQVALASSASTPPSGNWVMASNIDNNALWAVYVPTPSVAGTYYVWVETSSGQAAAVSSFALTVS